MSSEHAKQRLLTLVQQGKIMLAGQPLSLVELDQAHKDVIFLYERAKEAEESKTTGGSKGKKPAEDIK
jgi:hypothetical protein